MGTWYARSTGTILFDCLSGVISSGLSLLTFLSAVSGRFERIRVIKE